MSTTHLDRKELKQPDAFVAQTGNVFHFISDNIRPILIVVGVAMVVVLAAMGYSDFAHDRELKASGALFEARKTFETAAAKLPKNEADWESKLAPSIDKLDQAAAQYSHTAAAYYAHLALGKFYLNRGSYEKAALQLDKAVRASKQKELKYGALYLKGAALEGQKDYAGALALFGEVSEAKFKFLRADSLLAAARVSNLKGDPAKAQQIYAQVEQEYPQTPYATYARTQRAAK